MKELGTRWGTVLDTCILLNNSGAVLSYVLIIGTLVQSVLGGDNGQWYTNIAFVTVIPIMVFTVPLCLIRNFGHLAIVAYFSIGNYTHYTYYTHYT